MWYKIILNLYIDRRYDQAFLIEMYDENPDRSLTRLRSRLDFLTCPQGVIGSGDRTSAP
jgi:hypothetical protein